ncbi:MAG: hypothetical protein MK076_10230 [Flavobacteriales bacterium]|nr:hypothetical protein [Flavobacteriales bacterium]
MIYKDILDQEVTVDIDEIDGILELDFYGGKFGTEELLDTYKLTPKRLLEILQNYEEYKENEL